MEKQSINKSKIVKFVRGGVFSLLLLFQIGMIFYFNFSDVRNSLDSDFANTIYHFQEVIRNGTLNLENWNHTTSMELDATFLFAVPVYYLIHNIYTAVGIANMIYVVLYIVTICGIFRGLQVKKRYLFFTLCLVLTPYSFGMLEYFNMMFLGTYGDQFSRHSESWVAQSPCCGKDQIVVISGLKFSGSHLLIFFFIILNPLY